ncbi:helix-turn-helix domain-containing protein [Enterococcus sp. LJL51]|uniref:helix-turn-helix domain-containing protein n=1 Tax=Enterococcus sp. LJL51 TaxID=3416656 RepID=UPI003CEB28FB
MSNTEKTNEHELIKDRIYYYLEKKDITINRLAQLSNIRQSTLSSIINRQGVPRVDTIHQICRGLNITVKEFFDFPPYNKIDLDTNSEEELMNYLETVSEELRTIQERIKQKK